MKVNISKDYPLPNLFYFLPHDIVKIRNKIRKTCDVLEKSGFQACHLPFLVPKTLINTYQNSVPLNNFIKAYSGKNRDSYAYLRPDGIFSQGLTLAGKMIKSYRDLPLKLFELSPAYEKATFKDNANKYNILNSPEQSFSIQGAVFSENNGILEELENVIEKIIKKNSVPYTKTLSNYKKTKMIKFIHKDNDEKILLAKIYLFNQGVSKNNKIYFFSRKGLMTFPYMFSFSISQNIIFLSR